MSSNTFHPPAFSAPVLDYDRGQRVSLTGDGVLDAERHVLEQHWHTLRTDETDGYLNLPVRAVLIDAAGPAVEIGPWSVSPDEAQLLADSLRILAAIANSTTPETGGQ